MTPVFLDTIGLLAVWDASDQWNAAADAAFRDIMQRGRSVVTTPFILCGIAEAFTNDRHFHAAGFTTLF